MQTQPVLFPEFEQRLGAPLCACAFSPVVIAEAPEAIRDLPGAELEEKIVKAKAVLKWVMARFRTAFSTSFGKDSSATLGIALAAAAELVREGVVVQPFVVLTADTLVEKAQDVSKLRQCLTEKLQELQEGNFQPAWNEIKSLGNVYDIPKFGGSQSGATKGKK